MHLPSPMHLITISSIWKDQSFYVDGIEDNKQLKIFENIGNSKIWKELITPLPKNNCKANKLPKIKSSNSTNKLSKKSYNSNPFSPNSNKQTNITTQINNKTSQHSSQQTNPNKSQNSIHFPKNPKTTIHYFWTNHQKTSANRYKNYKIKSDYKVVNYMTIHLNKNHYPMIKYSSPNKYKKLHKKSNIFNNYILPPSPKPTHLYVQIIIILILITNYSLIQLLMLINFIIIIPSFYKFNMPKCLISIA
jgi:hypothetical protein